MRPMRGGGCVVELGVYHRHVARVARSGMNETLRLGTIAGVRLGVNWSVLVIVWLLLVGLSAVRFPLLYPGHTGLTYAIAGLAAAVAFLLSLLAPELAHAVVARHHGIVVEGITLWMLGGVAKLEGEARDPAADLRIAGVGPLVSLVLGLGFGVIALFAGGVGGEGLALGVLSWLSVVNVMVAVFNLGPAAPLDGGRILRSLLWRRHGSRWTASRPSRPNSAPPPRSRR
jgi:Zn-dependent protease